VAAAGHEDEARTAAERTAGARLSGVLLRALGASISQSIRLRMDASSPPKVNNVIPMRLSLHFRV
jgi:hypothetical protein